MRFRSLLRRVPSLLFRFFRRVPFDPLSIRGVLQGYSQEKFKKDIRASVEVALLALPQGMAYALIAGLPVQYGLYACAVGTIVGPFFASSRFAVLGPTNATAVIVMSSYLMLGAHVDKLSSLGLLLLMTGIFLIIGSFLRLATLTQYISRSVVVGYITGAAFLIIANQVHSMLGFSLSDSRTFLDTVFQTVRSLPATQGASVGLSLFTLALWWFLEKRFPLIPTVSLSLLIASIISYFLADYGWKVELLKALPFGFWPVSFPQVNPTWISLLASTAFALTIFTMIEGSSITKTLANRSGDVLDSNQEIYSYGMANIGCAIFGGMPCSGSLTRSVLNWSRGAVTQLSSLWSGIIAACAILLLGQFIGYIPKPALAALVICVGFSLIDQHRIRICICSTRSDGVVFFVTLFASLLTPLDFAIYLGVATSIVLYLRKAARPKLMEYTFDDGGSLVEKMESEPDPFPHLSIIHVEGALFFGASELFRDEIRKVCQDAALKVVILRLKNAYHLDASSVMAIEELAKYLRESDRYLIISGAGREVYRVLKNSGVLESIGKENIFMVSPHSPNVSTRRALLRAKTLLGEQDARVKIYYDPQYQTQPKHAEESYEI